MLRCQTHKRYFTVYPVGHVPYGRVRMAPVEPGGYPAGVEEDGAAAPWRGTLF